MLLAAVRASDACGSTDIRWTVSKSPAGGGHAVLHSVEMQAAGVSDHLGQITCFRTRQTHQAETEGSGLIDRHGARSTLGPVAPRSLDVAMDVALPRRRAAAITGTLANDGLAVHHARFPRA